MKLLHEIETIYVEIARLDHTIEKALQRIAVIEAHETVAAIREEPNERLHHSRLVIRLETLNEYLSHRNTLRESRTQRSILRAQLECKRGAFKLALLDNQRQVAASEEEVEAS